MEEGTIQMMSFYEKLRLVTPVVQNPGGWVDWVKLLYSSPLFTVKLEWFLSCQYKNMESLGSGGLDHVCWGVGKKGVHLCVQLCV